MTRIYIEDAGKHVGEEVTLWGWLHHKRSSGKIQFLMIRDGSGYIQGVLVKNAVAPEVFEAADSPHPRVFRQSYRQASGRLTRAERL